GCSAEGHALDRRRAALAAELRRALPAVALQLLADVAAHFKETPLCAQERAAELSEAFQRDRSGDRPGALALRDEAAHLNEQRAKGVRKAGALLLDALDQHLRVGLGR